MKTFDKELYKKLMDNIKEIPSDRFIEKSLMRSTALHICSNSHERSNKKDA